MHGRAHELLPPKLPRSRQAVRWHVGETAVLSLMGEPCVRKKCDKNGFLFETLSEPKRSIALTFEEFDLVKDGYEFDIDHAGATPGKAAAVLKCDEDMLANLPDEERELVKNKLIAVQKFLAMQARGAASRCRQNLAPILLKMQDKLFAPKASAKGGQIGPPTFRLVGPKRFLEWVDAYLEMGPLGLVNQYHLCGRRDDRYTWEERLVLLDYVYRYLSREAPTIAHLWRDMEEEFAKLNGARIEAAGPPGRWRLADGARSRDHEARQRRRMGGSARELAAAGPGPAEPRQACRSSRHRVRAERRRRDPQAPQHPLPAEDPPADRSHPGAHEPDRSAPRGASRAAGRSGRRSRPPYRRRHESTPAGGGPCTTAAGCTARARRQTRRTENAARKTHKDPPRPPT
jgi:hypothetical protein